MSTPHRGARPRLLLVEDEETVALTLGTILAESGYEVETARTVAEGLSRAEGTAFDAAVIDLRVGDEDGLRVLQPLKQRSREAIAVVLTGYGSIASVERAARLGAHAFLPKPCDVDELKRVLAGAPGPDWTLAERSVG